MNCVKEQNNNLKYERLISLGYWCGPALELRRLGKRNSSYPFDWLITDIQEVLRLIDNNFADFCLYENLAQYKGAPNYYADLKYNIHFYHDFDAYTSLKRQYESVISKYKRRIDRFYTDIQNPALFVRYVRDEKEGEYILENYNKIKRTLTKFNPKNDIIFIGDKNLEKLSLPNFFGGGYCEPNKKVIDNFFDKSSRAREFIEYNVVFTETNDKNIKNKKNKLLNFIVRKIKKLKKPYVHNKQYNYDGR